MRVVKAKLADSYKVHKTMQEFCADVCQKDDEIKDYAIWMDRLSDDSRHYLMLLHGKKVVGMLWGRDLRDEPKKTFLIEGRFLRRAYRGRFRFTREMLKLQKAVSEKFDSTRLLLPKNGVKLKKYRVLGTLVEVKNG